MSLWRNLRDFFKGYSDYQPSVAALVAYLPVGDLETLRLWRERHIPYKPDTAPTAKLVVNGNFVSSGTVTASGLPTSAGAGGLYVCIDTNGVMYKKSSCP